MVVFMSAGSEVEARLFFAHEQIRDTQKEMVSDGIIALNERGFLLAAAPTGIGKTAAALASAPASASRPASRPALGPNVPQVLQRGALELKVRIIW